MVLSSVWASVVVGKKAGDGSVVADADRVADAVAAVGDDVDVHAADRHAPVSAAGVGVTEAAVADGDVVPLAVSAVEDVVEVEAADAGQGVALGRGVEGRV